ncbi:hypothetical protein [Flavobacterium sp. HBTb2-11-1]|uniref:hypothetical protein n=1 Tax=Flavobacterium sp. HBTb2-11-1 TaxID=2692212 RepID=UPI0013696266|nr:hypothetical protein [Flavobacterium sp. HBTb2-11-1]MXO03959.1 hypothetical protein [Flavobacterium sp. HBTb2-11-1]
MTKTLKLIFIAITFLIFFGCSSGDCTKMITIPAQTIQTPSGSSYMPAYEREVACDFEIEPVEENTKELENFSYEILNFVYTPDTGKNTSRIQMEIKLNNLNDFNVTGVPIITVNVDGTESVGNFASKATSPCYGIDAKSSCIFTFDQETSLSLGLIKSVKIVSVKYIVPKK